MATFTGQLISATYDAILKTIDNDAIGAAAKQLTDGLGNVTPLYVSNTQIGIGITPTQALHVSGNALITGSITIDTTATISGNLSWGSLTDTGENITITKFVDAADGITNNDNDTTIPTSAAVKSFVDSSITDQDLDILGDSGSGSVDLDSQSLSVTGTTNQIITSALDQSISLSLPTTIHRNLLGDVTGNLTGNVTGGTISGTTGTFSANVDIDGTLDVDDLISIESNAFGRIEIGGSSGGYIDLKAPASDDYDLRIITSSGGNEITTATGDLIFNTAETLALTLNTSQNATFAGSVSATTGTFSGNISATTGTFSGQVTIPQTPVLNTDAASKGYVDTALAGQDTLAEVLAIGNTSGGTSMVISNGDDLTVNTSTLKVDSTNSQVGINNASPSGFTSAANDLIIGDGTSDRGMTIYSSNQAYGHIYFQDAESSSSTNGGFISYTHVGDGFEIGVAGNGQGAGSLSISQTSVYTRENFIVDASFTSVYNTLTVDASSGKLGIRNNAPTYPLDVNGTSRLDGLTYIVSDLTVGTDSLFVDVSEDSVGIGLTNPSAYSVDTLVINTPDEKGITLVSSSTEKAYIAFQDGTGALENFMSFDHASSKMNFNVFDTSGDISFSLGEGVQKLTINNTNVGIDDGLIVSGDLKSGDLGDPYLFFADVSAATVHITGRIDIDGSPVATGDTRAVLSIDENNSASAGRGGGLTFGRQGNVYGGIKTLQNTSSNDNATMYFQTIGGGTVSNRMVIDESGNVGIGTSSPTQSKLDILNNGDYDSHTGHGLAINSYAGNAYTSMYMGADDTIDSVYIQSAGRNTSFTSKKLLLNPNGGNVGIGATNPGEKLTVSGDGRFTGGSAGTLTIKHNYGYQQPNWGIKLDGDTGKTGGYLSQYLNLGGFALEQGGTYYGGGPWKTDANSTSYSSVNGKNGEIIFYTNTSLTANTVFNPSERMRITSGGNVLVGKTADDDNTVGCRLSANGMVSGTRSGNVSGIFGRNDSVGNLILFRQDSTQVGRIVVTASSTSYVTNSDYRLKENVVGMTGALDRVSQLKPSRFNFIADADKTVDGFLAHEVQEIVPEAISGEKDAMQDEEYEVSPAIYEDILHPAIEQELDEEGNVITEAKEEWTEKVLVSEKVMGTREVPDYQGIDQSKLVPLLVGAIQELKAEVDKLKQECKCK